MTDAYIYSLKAVIKLGSADQQLDTLTSRTLSAWVDTKYESEVKINIYSHLFFHFKMTTFVHAYLVARY